jgi:hypothetical protein
MKKHVSECNELVPAKVPSKRDILTRFREWMRLDVAAGNASEETIRSYFSDRAFGPSVATRRPAPRPKSLQDG